MTARDAVVVPPAKDAENNVALAVKSSMVDALARSGNRVLERVATPIKKAGHHKNEAAYVRDELLKARSECRKLGITGTSAGLPSSWRYPPVQRSSTPRPYRVSPIPGSPDQAH